MTVSPIRIVLKSLLGCSVSLWTKAASLNPDSIIELIFILLTYMSDVSDAEKKPERHNKANNNKSGGLLPSGTKPHSPRYNKNFKVIISYQNSFYQYAYHNLAKYLQLSLRL